MLLSALHELAQSKRLLDELPLQRRTLHALIPLSRDGELRMPHLIVLSQGDAKGKERPGLERLLPRFPGENNGGKAYFLAESTIPLLGRDKETGEPVFADPDRAPRKEKNPAKAFQHFWCQVQDAHATTGDPRLAALLAFKSKYLTECEDRVGGDLPFLAMRLNKKGKPEFAGRFGPGAEDSLLLKSATLGFSVDGVPLTLDDEADPLRTYWFDMFRRLSFQVDGEDEKEGQTRQSMPTQPAAATLCLVTGQTGLPVARSHKPKILGVPGLSSGGYVVSFAKESRAFSSYGFEMGQNAPISENAAASYALALNELLANEDTHLNLGPLSICFWAKTVPQAARQFNLLISKAHPEQVREFLSAPLAGVEREVLKRDRLYTVALSGNAGRVVVQHWIDETLDEAIQHFAQWWADLEIVPVIAVTAEMKQKRAKANQATEPAAWPLAIGNLARVSLRRSKEQKDDKLVSERIVQLYRAALEGTAPPVTFLKPILDEFQSALIKNDDSDAKKRTYPFNSSRFALIKLILTRLERSRRTACSQNHTPSRKETGFMPSYELAETADPAYNLGRLLAVFEMLQDKYHEGDKKSAGVVERYYGTASSAPAAAFPILARLARHHLSKVRRDHETAAAAIDRRIGEILVKFEPKGPGQPPKFPRVLSLEEQGRFALGFYQQRAFNSASFGVYSLLKRARDIKNDSAQQDALLAQARELAEQFRTAELLDAVNRFRSNENSNG